MYCQEKEERKKENGLKLMSFLEMYFNALSSQKRKWFNLSIICVQAHFICKTYEQPTKPDTIKVNIYSNSEWRIMLSFFYFFS